MEADSLIVALNQSYQYAKSATNEFMLEPYEYQ